MTVQTKRPVMSDILVNMYSDVYNVDDLTITNGGAVDWDLDAGYPLDANVPVVAGGEANTDGILLNSETVPAGESIKVMALVRGPATLKSGGLVAIDRAGAAMNTALIQTALEALDMVFRDEPSNISQQTT